VSKHKQDKTVRVTRTWDRAELPEDQPPAVMNQINFWAQQLEIGRLEKRDDKVDLAKRELRALGQTIKPQGFGA
jgi:hypothetical protein